MVMNKPLNYTPWGIHHYYTGGVILTIGFILIFFSHKFVSGAFMATGMYLILDDILQHLHQGHDIWWWKKNPAFVSPLHRWYWAALLWLIPKTKEGSMLRRLLEWMRKV